MLRENVRPASRLNFRCRRAVDSTDVPHFKPKLFCEARTVLNINRATHFSSPSRPVADTKRLKFGGRRQTGRLVRRAAEHGIDAALMHQMAVVGSGTLDSLPHNGGIVMLLAVCGTTHRESYL